MDFHTAYRDLEAQMRARAEADGDVFLPNPEPSGPADWVFVCMEPSLGVWARSPEQATPKVKAGYRNFVTSLDDFILHFSITHYLCGPTERYHITDLSKGAMPVKRAEINRTHRWDSWYGLLLEELDLVAKPGAGMFAVGRLVEDYLRQRASPRPLTYLLHYSGAARRHRRALIVGRESSFEQFKSSISLELVLATAEEVLNASVPARFRDETLARLARTELSESDKQLIFNYKLTFERQSSHSIGRVRGEAVGPT